MNAVVKTRPAGTGGLEEAPGRLLGGGGWGERVEIRKGAHEAWKQRGRRKARSWRFWDDNECKESDHQTLWATGALRRTQT